MKNPPKAVAVKPEGLSMPSFGFDWPIDFAKLTDDPPPQYASEKQREFLILRAELAAKRALAELKANMAAGNVEAARVFLHILSSETDWLEGFAYRNLKLIRSLAPHFRAWPILAGRHPLRKSESEAYLKRIGLAEKVFRGKPEHSKWGIAKQKGATETTASVAATFAVGIHHTVNCAKASVFMASLFHRLNQKNGLPETGWPPPRWALDAEKLKPFSKKSADAWFEVGWQALLEATKGHPEQNPELLPLGEYRRKHGEQTGQKKNATSKTDASNIRAGIKERLQITFRNFAP